MKNPYLEHLKELYEVCYNKEDSEAMSAYMKNKFEFYGIKSEKRKEIVKQFLKENGLPPSGELDKIILELWDLPEREYQYFGMELVKKHLKDLNPKSMRLIEFMILNKSWWDTIDYISSNIVGGIFISYPELIDCYTDKWVDSDNIWLKRTALLFQLKYRSETNEKLLFENILKLSDSDEFFIQKAIGWSLREYSKHEPARVIKFVKKNKLKPLSEREALKFVKKIRVAP